MFSNNSSYIDTNANVKSNAISFSINNKEIRFKLLDYLYNDKI